MAAIERGGGGGDDAPPWEVATVARPQRDGVAAPLRALVVEGPDAGKAFVLDPLSANRILLGTSPACDLRVADATVSRRHAAFEPVGRRFRITDLGSTNGTFVDGVSIVDGYVGGGELVRCGATALRLDPEPAGRVELPPRVERFHRTLGGSDVMLRLYPFCERLARSRVPVLIEGETGTGKEVLAESIHEASGIKGPFVVFDCTAVSPTLVEAELFGHDRGAFTGAIASRAGVFEQADGGTLFVDEIGELDLSLQPKLLRALDRSEIRRVGGNTTIKVDVRILAATRRDLDREVAAGRFRDDLFHRLAVGRVELPALRERRGDIAFLARHFATLEGATADVLTAEALARFEDYPWPGNVRELRNAVARLVALGEAVPGHASRSDECPPAAEQHVAAWVDTMIGSGVSFPRARRTLNEQFEKRYVERILEAHGGNVARAAAASGIARRYFQLVKARRGGS